MTRRPTRRRVKAKKQRRFEALNSPSFTRSFLSGMDGGCWSVFWADDCVWDDVSRPFPLVPKTRPTGRETSADLSVRILSFPQGFVRCFQIVLPDSSLTWYSTSELIFTVRSLDEVKLTCLFDFSRTRSQESAPFRLLSVKEERFSLVLVLIE